MIERAAKALLAAMILVAAPGSGGSARAQGLDLGSGDAKPLEIYADEGIEWDQKNKRYVARGNAKAIQGDTTVHADTLTAYYEEKNGKGSQITRIEAVGKVKIVSPSQTAYGDKGVYDSRQNVLVLTGRRLKLVTKDNIITARDRLEYHDRKSLAVARGNALLRQRNPVKGKQRTVRADVLTSRSRPKPSKGKRGRAKKSGDGGGPPRMDAYGNVVISLPGEIALANRAVYHPDQDTAELWGKVRITRGQNQFNGERAIINFKTGISRILAGKGGKDKPPVRVLIVPSK
ncbi:MAG: LptA/OstA family protein [Alphaproteobacteria bacterium]